MICKKIIYTKKKNKEESIRALTNYIYMPYAKNGKEKLLYYNASGFICSGFYGRQLEMITLANASVRSPNPVNHYILSWCEDEQPSNLQIDELIEIFMQQLGLLGHQVIYALHMNTENIHLHVVINRVNPESELVVEINGWFDIFIIHQAILRIELNQGWRSEVGATHKIIHGGIAALIYANPGNNQQQNSRVRDKEQQTGSKSAQRIAIERCADILETSNTWQELHQKLGNQFATLHRTRSNGGLILIGNIPIKLSSISREVSFPRLVKRLGIFEPHQGAANVYFKHTDVDFYTEELDSSELRGYSANSLLELSVRHVVFNGQGSSDVVLQANAGNPRWQFEALRWQSDPLAVLAAPQALSHNTPELREYSRGRAVFVQEKSKARHQIRVRHDLEFSNFLRDLRLAREEHLQGDWCGRGAERNALQASLAKDAREQIKRLKAQHKLERQALSRDFPNYPNFEDWLRANGMPRQADSWRHRNSIKKIIGPGVVAAVRQQIPGYHVSNGVNGCLIYTHQDNQMDAEQQYFVEYGGQIEFCAEPNKVTIIDALRIAQFKWPSITVCGADQFKNTCVELAIEHQFQIDNSELQSACSKGLLRLSCSMNILGSEIYAQFLQYDSALQAESYCITSAKKMPDNLLRVKLLTHHDRVSLGIVKDDFYKYFPDITKLQSTGEHICYTPHSAHCHYIVIANMDAAQLSQLQKKGYKPSVVLEVELGLFQAILVIQQRGSEFDRDASFMLRELLNQKYAGSNVSEYLPAHFAPACLAHAQKLDADFPAIRMIFSEKRICEKTQKLASRFAIRYENELKELRESPHEIHSAQSKIIQISRSPHPMYHRHFYDIKLRQDGAHIDLSRIDAMIAIRLRVTGHPRSEIKSILLICSPTVRTDPNERDWNLYVDRVVDYVYGFDGSRRCTDQARYREQWLALEDGLSIPNQLREPSIAE